VLEKYADWKEGNVSGKTVGNADFPKESPSSSEKGDQLVCRIILSLSIYNGPTNAVVCNKTLIQMSHTKTLKITPTCFDHQMIIIRELFDTG
jgi:hypothetical protein